MGKIVEELREAIQKKKCVELDYDNHQRLVEVHLVGANNKSQKVLAIVWQLSGGSKSGNIPDWRTLEVDKITNATQTELNSKAPREGYSPQRGQYVGIIDDLFCEV